MKNYVLSMMLGYITGLVFGAVFIMPDPIVSPEYNTYDCLRAWCNGALAGMATSIGGTLYLIWILL